MGQLKNDAQDIGYTALILLMVPCAFALILFLLFTVPWLLSIGVVVILFLAALEAGKNG